MGHSIKLRLVAAFLLLAVAMALVFIGGAQRAFSIGWREAARPLLMDYVDHLAAELTPDPQQPPSVARAQALTQRLPLTVAISGPVVNWDSHPGHGTALWSHSANAAASAAEAGAMGAEWQPLLQRRTADGHRIVFGLNDSGFERRPRMLVYALLAVLALTGLAFLYVRRLLRPLDDIGAGARRFGAGEFGQPIPVRHAHQPDELGQLAGTINTMGQDIHQMLEAKRALLLAISHELRSPLTRARLHAELLPESAAVQPQRDALLRDLQEMAQLIGDLLESERLASPHAALQREPVDAGRLMQDVLADWQARHPEAPPPQLQIATALPTLQLDPARLRLLLRNLLDNAWRHAGQAAQPPHLTLAAGPDGQGLRITLRDFGPGVPEAQLPHLAEPFYRPDSARTRAAGGVGLGLSQCQRVAQAHGGGLSLRNAHPGLAVTVDLPGD